MMNRYVRINRQQARDQKFQKKHRIPYNLQLFAEDSGDSGDDGSGDADDDSEDSDDDKGGEPEKKYTDADIDKIVKERLARERKAAEKKARQQAEAEKLKNMTAAEKRDAEFEQMKARLASLEAEKNQAEMLSTALVGHLIAETADETKANVDEFVKLYNDAVNKGIKTAMKAAGSNPKKGGTSTLTKEDIMKVKNSAERQKLINENMHLFR